MRENVLGRCGWKRGLPVLLFCSSVAAMASAQSFAILHNFSGTDGSAPNSPLVQGFDGKLYGTTTAEAQRAVVRSLRSACMLH